MKKFIFVSIFVQLSITIVYSQTDPLYSETLQEATEYILEEDFTEPLYLLQNLESKGYTYPNIDFWIGYCYLNSVNKKELAISRFQNAVKNITPAYDYNNYSELKAPAEAYLYLGDAYLVTNDLTLAKAAYQKYIQLTTDPKKKDIATQRLRECIVAKIINSYPSNGELVNAGKAFNNGLSNTNACISGDGNSIVFLKKLKFYDALFYSVKTDSGWIEPINITTQTGSDGNFIPTALDFDGKKMLLESYTAPNGYDIYESSFNGIKWTKIRRFTAPINSVYNENDASYTSNGQSIIFSSNRDGGLGGADLYRANIGLTKEDISIENLGAPINTSGNEKCPMLLEKDSLLVYNTDILYGMGGYDYYHSRLQPNNTWTIPFNMGKPFNTTGNDNQLRLSTAKKEGVIARTDPKGYNDIDVMLLSYSAFGNFRFIPVTGTLQLNGKSLENPQNRLLIIIDNKIKDTIDIVSADTTGSFTTNLYPGKFNLIVQSNDTIEHVQEITLSEEPGTKTFNLLTNIQKQPATAEQKQQIKPEIQTQIVKPDTLYVSNILFGFNKTDLSNTDREIFNKWLNGLKIQNIRLIKLTGFSDAIGSNEYNIALSLNRAKTIKAIMINKGIPESLISIQGKGNTDFIAPNTTTDGKDNPKGRALNRRVEIELELTNPDVLIIIKNNIPKHNK